MITRKLFGRIRMDGKLRLSFGFCAFVVSPFVLFAQVKEPGKEAEQEQQPLLAPKYHDGIEMIAEAVNEMTVNGCWPITVICRCDPQGQVVEVNGIKKSLADFVDRDLPGMKAKVKGDVGLVVGVIEDSGVRTKEDMLKIEKLLSDRGVTDFTLFPFRLMVSKENVKSE